MLELLARWYCRQFHRSITTPVNGTYTCLHCLRSYQAVSMLPTGNKPTTTAPRFRDSDRGELPTNEPLEIGE